MLALAAAVTAQKMALLGSQASEFHEALALLSAFFEEMCRLFRVPLVACWHCVQALFLAGSRPTSLTDASARQKWVSGRTVTVGSMVPYVQVVQTPQLCKFRASQLRDMEEI